MVKRRILSEGMEKKDRCYTRVWSQGKWELKQRYIWKKRYGSIPDGYFICFLDGDRSNFSLGNLICVPPAVSTYIGRMLGSDRTAELTRTAIMTYELEHAVKEARG